MAPARLREFLRGLRKAFPPRLPVSVRQRTLADRSLGYTTRTQTGFAITLHSAMSERLAQEILLHEWSHTLCWVGRVDHSPRWASHYARLRRWFQGEDEYGD